MVLIDNFIGGKWVRPHAGRYLDNIDPARGEVYSRVADSGAEDVADAVNAAARAFPAWSRMPAQERSTLLLRIADLIDARAEELARAESIDTGKPISLSRTMDIPRASANMRFFATAILHKVSEAHFTDTTAINYSASAPVGVAGCISPWNLPLYLFTWKIAPALAAGCTVVGKPSELAPSTAHLLTTLCAEAGLPPGVLNVVHGYGRTAGQAIVEHPLVRAISFTGGTATGKQIAATAAPMFKKLSLELGGKNPNLVFADCDLDKAVATSVRAAFTNQGEICLCGSRILVERSVYQTFLDSFVAKTREMVTGDPLAETTTVGALISAAHFKKVMSYIDLAKQEGGTILAGGQRLVLRGDLAGGYFIPPTIISGLHSECRTNQEEIFGPVVTIQPFDTEEEAVSAANGTAYGLSATIWTENLSRAHRVAAAVRSGVVWVNCWLLRDLRTPFGGLGQSGVGTEGGWHALGFFTETKNVCIRL